MLYAFCWMLATLMVLPRLFPGIPTIVVYAICIVGCLYFLFF